MTQVTVNFQESEPYRNFKFRLKWDGRYVAGISKVNGIKRTTEVIKIRTGADPDRIHKSPGITEFEAVILEKSVTHDVEFEQWVNKIWDQSSTGSISDFKKDITIELYNEAGGLVLAYNLSKCWISEYQLMVDLDANVKAAAFQQIKLEHEGWQVL